MPKLVCAPRPRNVHIALAMTQFLKRAPGIRLQTKHRAECPMPYRPTASVKQLQTSCREQTRDRCTRRRKGGTWSKSSLRVAQGSHSHPWPEYPSASQCDAGNGRCLAPVSSVAREELLPRGALRVPNRLRRVRHRLSHASNREPTECSSTVNPLPTCARLRLGACRSSRRPPKRVPAILCRTRMRLQMDPAVCSAFVVRSARERAG